MSCLLAGGLIVSCLAPAPVRAQEPTAAVARAEAARVAEVAPDSPRAAVGAYLDAARAGRWDEAARYLSLPDEPEPRGPRLAERLKAVLDRHLWIEPAQLAPTSSGRTDDGLPLEAEEIGVLRLGEGPGSPVRLVRVGEGDGARWIFAQGTVQQIDAWYDALAGRWITDRLLRYRLDALLASGPFGILWWQWVALLAGAAVAWLAGRALRGLTRTFLIRIPARTATAWDDRLLLSVGPPIRVAWALFVFAWIGSFIGLSVPAANLLAQAVRVAGVATFFWAAWRSVDISIAFLLSRPWAADSPSARHLFTIGANLAKGVVAALGVLALLAALGYEVTTVLAGLGIGGLALAFGAQKTVENLFGSVALAVDQPFRVGDFVRVGDFTGTVEDIGLRSTRFRTPDRTLITIPNGALADQRLESLAERDRMRLSTVLGLEYRTTRAQLEQVLAGFRAVLASHPKIWPDTVIVTLAQLGQHSLDIEIVAWFQTEDTTAFNQYRQDVLLGFMRVVEQAGTAFAFPTRTVHVVAPEHGSSGPRA